MSTPAARPCRPRLTAAQGPRVEQRAILARTRGGARAKAKRKQKQKQKQKQKLLTSPVLPERRPKSKCRSSSLFDSAAARLRSGRSDGEGKSRGFITRRSRGGAAAAHQVRVTMARCSTRGLSEAAGGRRKSP